MGEFIRQWINLKRLARRVRDYHGEWRRVPPPNWACKRNGRDVW